MIARTTTLLRLDLLFVDDQVSRLVLDLMPLVVDLPSGMLGVERIPGRRRRMTVQRRLVPGNVLRGHPELIVQVAREIPTQPPIRSLRDSASGGGGDQPPTVLVDPLEQETGILSSGLPSVREQRVRGSVERVPSGRMGPVGKLVSVTVDEEISLVGFPSLDTESLGTADGLGKSESDETDDTHEEKDERDEPDLFPPGSLGFTSVLACGSRGDDRSSRSVS